MSLGGGVFFLRFFNIFAVGWVGVSLAFFGGGVFFPGVSASFHSGAEKRKLAFFGF